MTDPLLEISALGKSYPTAKGPSVIVQNFTLRIRAGEFVCIIGHSGCGKSTVLSIMMGLNEASEGGVILNGREVDGPGLERGVVFQTPALLPWLSAVENVELAVDQVAKDATKEERRALAERALGLVGLEGQGHLSPAEMSAGMRQRVGIARAFALDPSVLLLDEPFSLLDALTRMELQDEVMRLWEEQKKTVVMVTHDVDEALFLADRVVMMTSGPAATIGDILEVPLPRPRRREQAVDDPNYYVARERLLSFLEGHSAHRDPADEMEAVALAVPSQSEEAISNESWAPAMTASNAGL